MLDRVTGMEVFSRVAALGSLSAAGRALGMSQTMVTKHMAALEERLGVKLLHRSTRRVTPTEAGRRYLELVDRILPDLAEAEALVAAERIEVSGTLRVNAPVSFGMRRLAPLLAGFSGRHPALTVDLGLNDRVVDLVEEGWDVAIRIGTLTDGALIARRIAPCPMMVCAAPAYLAAHGVPGSVHDLPGHNCLGYTLSRAVGAERWHFAGDVSVPVRGTLRASNGDALLAAALEGLGIIYQPDFLVAEEVHNGRLVPLTLDVPPIELPGIHAVYPANRRPPAKLRAFIDFLVEALPR
ncbi:LysR family transcriptional regulator [Neoroseomonas soli]|uniref:LysR family transcriptional regulator n=1 Tax=Neoroseomonas soli TaxID=1081025 RepID=A0A9X9WTD4_9PROT|nr:LysR family transcriptional regulator [Neoroseomonas soli]MBR0670413.1 LysR family transcriptional regulator [Neoroseomonas soli]